MLEKRGSFSSLNSIQSNSTYQFSRRYQSRQSLRYTSNFQFPRVKLTERPGWNSSTKLLYKKMSDVVNGIIETNGRDSPKLSSEKIESNNNLPNGIPDDEIITGVKIFDIWSQKLSQDKISAEIAWSRCRKLASEALHAFNLRVKSMENVVTDDVAKLSTLDVEEVKQKKAEIEGTIYEIEDLDIEFKDVSKAYQNVAQFLPDTPERQGIKNEIKTARKNYFRLLESLVRKKEFFRVITPLLEQYKQCGTDIKSWLDITELKGETFLLNYNDEKLILSNEEMITNIYNEIYEQKDVYENFMEAGEAILDLDVESPLTELEADIDDVRDRWDNLCSNLEKCFNRLRIAKALAENTKKNDVEKIEQQIRSESKMCTCHNPFQIVKVGDGKYTFGSSKIVRLLRIHGNSIVVRVGGGWEYLYDFLLKTDPCRAKQYHDSKHSSETFNLSGLDLTPLDKRRSGEFNLNVKRVAPTYKSYRQRQVDRKLSVSLGSAASSNENLDTGDDSSDSMSVTSSLRSSTPFSSHKYMKKQYSQDSLTSLPSSNGKKNSSRRLSLIERQSQYAEKRRSLQYLDKIGK